MENETDVKIHCIMMYIYIYIGDASCCYFLNECVCVCNIQLATKKYFDVFHRKF